MVGYCVTVLYVLVGSFLTTYLTKKRVGYVAPFVCMAIALWIYLFAIILHSLRAAFITLTIAMLAICAAALRKRISAAERRDRCLQFTTLGGFSIIVFALVALLFAKAHGPFVLHWDEYAHWGQMAKELIRLDWFYTVPETTLLFHNDYPPIIPLWEVIGCIPLAKYDILTMYSSLWFLQLCMFLPVLEWIGEQRTKHPFFVKAMGLGFILCFATVVSFNSGDGSSAFWKNIYVDVIFALVGGMGLAMAARYGEVGYSNAGLAVVLVFLILIKQAAIVYVVLIFLVLLWRAVEVKKSANSGVVKRNESVVRDIGLCLLSAVIAYCTWRGVCYTSIIDSVNNGQFSVGSIIKNISNGFDGYQIPLIKSYIRALLFRPLSPSPLAVTSYACFPFVCMGAMLFVATLQDKDYKCVLNTSVLMLLCSGAYALFMGAVYLFGIPQVEAVRLASFERYMGTFCISLAIWSMYMSLSMIRSITINKGTVLGVIALFVFVTYCAPLSLNNLWVYDKAAESSIKREASFLTDNVPANNRVFVVDQGSSPTNILKYCFYCDGITISRDVEETVGDGGYSSKEKSWVVEPSQLLQSISDEQYLFVRNTDERFNKRYSQLFSRKLENGRLYRIESCSNNNIMISPVAKLS